MRTISVPALAFLVVIGLAPAVGFTPSGSRADDVPVDGAFNARGDYHTAGRNLDLKEKVVDEVILLGREAAESLLPMVRRDMDDAVNTYGRAFSRQLHQSQEETVAAVLASSDTLPARRERAVQVGHMAERLSIAAGSLLYDEQSFDEHLAELENSTLRLAVLGEILSQLDDEEVEAFHATNAAREENGLPPLEIDLKLVYTARDHSNDMRTHNFFSHTSPIEGKTTFADRGKRFGTLAHGENIYAGGTSGATAVERWMNSPGHRANILSPDYTRIGIGRSNGHWTQNFGR